MSISASEFLKWMEVFGVRFGPNPPGEIEWVALPAASVTAGLNIGYICQNAAQSVITLPVSAPLGSQVSVAGLGAGGWQVLPGAGQTIRTVVGTASTSITSAEAQDTITFLCVVTNTTWEVLNSTSTGLVIV